MQFAASFLSSDLVITGNVCILFLITEEVLVNLNRTIAAKSDKYHNSVLRSIFLLNNCYYLQSALQTGGLFVMLSVSKLRQEIELIALTFSDA